MHIGLSEIGGIVGLFGGLVVLYDRYYKARPMASLTVNVGTPSVRKTVWIRIKNPTPYDIAIIGATNRQGVYFLAENEETHTLIEGASGNLRFAFMLKPNETKQLIVCAKFKDGIPLEITNRYVEFLIWWRRGDATWLPKMPVFVCTTTEVIRLLGGAD